MLPQYVWNVFGIISSYKKTKIHRCKRWIFVVPEHFSNMLQVLLLRPDIVMAYMPYHQQIKQNNEKYGIADKFEYIHFQIGIVCAHSHTHEGVGEKVIMVLCGECKPCKSADKRHADWDGKAPYYKGQKALHRAHGNAAKDAAGKPFQQFGGYRFRKACVQTAYDV